MRLGTPTLDFIVIGAQKAGTTSLWRYLEDNPRLRMPPDKEAPFFSEPSYQADWRGYMRALFKDAPSRTRRGTVTPSYMVGSASAPVPVVAARIYAMAPDVRLVVLLREPVARAHSAYRMLARREQEPRSFRQAIEELLAPEALERSRRAPVDPESYVVAGEYGRMLAAYLEHFDRGQLHVEMTADIERDPQSVVSRVCEFVGVEPHVPAAIDRRFHESGRPRVSPDAERDLKAYLDRNVWPRMRQAEQHRVHFEHFFGIWNVEPEPPSEEVDPETARLLGEHYAQDARTLEAVAGVRAPWVA